MFLLYPGTLFRKEDPALPTPNLPAPSPYAAETPTNTSLVQVWPLGSGYVAYLGAAIVPADVLFNTTQLRQVKAPG